MTDRPELGRVLLDAGPFIRFGVVRDSLHARVLLAVERILDQGGKLCFSPQTVREAWNVLTRPKESRGYGYPIPRASEVLRGGRELFTFLPDTPAIFDEWELLVAKYGIVGKSVHDANVVATVLAHGASHVLTLNERDFRRYSEVGTIVP